MQGIYSEQELDSYYAQNRNIESNPCRTDDESTYEFPEIGCHLLNSVSLSFRLRGSQTKYPLLIAGQEFCYNDLQLVLTCVCSLSYSYVLVNSSKDVLRTKKINS